MSPIRLRIVVGLLLAVLATASFVASFGHLGSFALTVALSIATIKASLVLVFFMEVGKQSASFKLALAAGVLLLVTMLALVATDVSLRRGPSWANETTSPRRADDSSL
jgi:cytochrome c oxidase subunit 4